MSVSTTPTLRHRIDEVERRIEHLEAQIEALQAVRAQLKSELVLARLFPAGSGFVQD